MKIAYDRISLTFVGRQKLLKKSTQPTELQTFRERQTCCAQLLDIMLGLIRVSMLLKLLLISSRILLKQHHMGLST